MQISSPHDIELSKSSLLVIFQITDTTWNMFILWISFIEKFFSYFRLYNLKFANFLCGWFRTHYSNKSNKTYLNILFNSFSNLSCDRLFWISTTFCLCRFKEIHFILWINSNIYAFSARENCCYYESPFANVFVGFLYIRVIEKCRRYYLQRINNCR